MQWEIVYKTPLGVIGFAVWTNAIRLTVEARLSEVHRWDSDPAVYWKS